MHAKLYQVVSKQAAEGEATQGLEANREQF